MRAAAVPLQQLHLDLADLVRLRVLREHLLQGKAAYRRRRDLAGGINVAVAALGEQGGGHDGDAFLLEGHRRRHEARPHARHR